MSSAAAGCPETYWAGGMGIAVWNTQRREAGCRLTECCCRLTECSCTYRAWLKVDVACPGSRWTWSLERNVQANIHQIYWQLPGAGPEFQTLTEISVPSVLLFISRKLRIPIETEKSEINLKKMGYLKYVKCKIWAIGILSLAPVRLSCKPAQWQQRISIAG